MSKITLPKHPGKFRVTTAKAGNLIVINDKTGKSQVIIPCRSQTQANELCERLNSGDHRGEVRV